MEGVKNFFSTIGKSIYSPEFYASLPKKSFGQAFGYFFLLILLLTFVKAISPIWIFATVGQKAIEQFVLQAGEKYPSKLEVTIKNGMLSTNVSEPYFFPISGNQATTEIQNIAVIDTKTPFSTEQFHAYKTAAWVAKDAIFVTGDSNSQIRTIDLSKVSDVTINKNTVKTIITKILPFLRVLPLFVGIAVLIGLYIGYAFRLIYLLLLAFVIWIVMKMLSKKYTYGQSYKVGMYAVTAAFLVEIVLGWTQYHGFSFMFTLVTLAVVILNSLPKSTTKTKNKKK